MKREIKFRVWDENTKQIHYFNLIDNSIKKEYTLYEWAKLPVMQFTGLLDKNGNEVYEGDLLDGGWKNEVFVVKFEDGRWVDSTRAEYKSGITMELSRGLTNGRLEYKEIIGNIFENP